MLHRICDLNVTFIIFIRTLTYDILINVTTFALQRINNQIYFV